MSGWRLPQLYVLSMAISLFDQGAHHEETEAHMAASLAQPPIQA
jgi:hypothetical protein